jgi:DNA-directed RNA polymerase subunit RPC12/RpoP
VFRANGPDDYVCAECGNVLAASMSHEQMTLKVRIRCGRCRTVNVAVTDIKGSPIRIR